MDETTRERIIRNEYYIPRKLTYLSQKYPLVTWEEACKLYELSVEETKIFFKAQHIVDIPWGQGYCVTKQFFEDKLLRLNEFRARQTSKDKAEEEEDDRW